MTFLSYRYIDSYKGCNVFTFYQEEFTIMVWLVSTECSK